MTTQINLKFQEDFYKLTKEYAESRGYMSVQELVREALRDKIFSNTEIKEEYERILKSKEASTFLSEKDSEKFHEELKKKAKL